MTRRTQFIGTAFLLGATLVTFHAWSLSAQDDVRSSDAGGGAGIAPPGSAGPGQPASGIPRNGAPAGQNRRTARPGGATGGVGSRSGLPSMPGAMMNSGGGFGGGMGSMSSMAGMLMGSQSGPVRSKTVTRTFQEVIHEPVPAEELEEYEAFQNAMQALKNAKDDTEKKKASDTVREHLVKQLDRDLVQREQELAEVEERVKQLKQQLAKRKSSKDEIVTLRLKTIINNAEGLGFPGDDVSQDTNTFPGGADRAPGTSANPFNVFRTNSDARE